MAGRIWAAALAATVATWGAAVGAGAGAGEGRAAYDISIAGIPIGDAELGVRLRGAAYVVDASADFRFLFWGGEGSARTEGAIGEGAFAPRSYRLAYEGVTRPGGVEIDFDEGRAVRWARTPPLPPRFSENRTEVTEGDTVGALDPLTALVVPAGPGTSSEALCRRVLPIFSGFVRFDLELTGAREGVVSEVVCEVAYRPVVGHRADSRNVARLSRPNAFELSLAPLAEGVWAPKRLAIETRFGLFELERED